MNRTIVLVGLLLLFFADGELAMTREAVSSWVLSMTTLLLSLHCAYRFTFGKQPLFVSAPFILFLLAWIWLALVSLVNGPWYDSEFHLARYLLLLVVFFCLSQQLDSFSLSDFQRYAALIFLGIGALCIAGALGLSWGYADLDLRDSFFFTGGNRNHFSCALLLLFFMVLPRCLTSSSLQERIVWGVASLLGALMIVCSGSRNALIQLFVFLALFVLSAVWIYKLWRRPKLLIAGVVLALAATGVIVGWMIPEYTLDKLISLGENRSDYGRLSVWRVVFSWVTEDFASLIFGHGAGYLYEHAFTFPTHELSYRLSLGGFAYSHSEYLDLLLEGGVVLFLLLALAVLWILYGAFKSVFCAGKSPLSQHENLQRVGLFTGIAAVGFFALFSVATRYTYVLLPVVFALALLCNVAGPRVYKLRSPGFAILAVLLCLCAGTCGAYGMSHRLLADWHYLKYFQTINAWYSIQDKAINEHSPIEQNNILELLAGEAAGTSLEVLSRAASGHLERGLSHNPYHAQLLFKQYERIRSDRLHFTPEQVEAAFLRLEAAVPNLAGSRLLHAQYLADVGDYERALELARQVAEMDYYNLNAQVEVLFLDALDGRDDSLLDSAAQLFVKSAQAEMQRSHPLILDVTQVNQNLVSIKFTDRSGPEKTLTLDIDMNLFIDEIFSSSGALTRHELRQIAVGLLREVYGRFLQIERPVFMEMFRVVEI